MAIKAQPTFSLKDKLFNHTKVSQISQEILVVYPEFKAELFVAQVIARFPELELLERLYWIRDCLQEYLPQDFRQAVGVLLAALPPASDPTLNDDDFGDFIYGPYGAFVAKHGCSIDDLHFSLQALKEMTKRFSVEFPIRSFINSFPLETLTELNSWSGDTNYHVRRLASEGTRPLLPWAKKINISHKDPLSILEVLYADQTRYVTRSVANHLNDLSKFDPELVLSTLKRWQRSKAQAPLEMDFITRHSLRTLEKQGNADALAMLGYGSREVKLQAMELLTSKVVIGEALEFSFSVSSTASQAQKVLIDYHLYFQKATGQLAPKTFKIARLTLAPGEIRHFTKQHILRPMTTRVLHPGIHQIELQINGSTFPRREFVLETS